MRMPSRDAQLRAATIAVGVASTNAHGHATINIVIAFSMATTLSSVKYQTMPASMTMVGVYQPA